MFISTVSLISSNVPHLSSALNGIRLSLHVLAAAVWVGGQIVLAGLVPKVRKVSPEVLSAIANQFAKMAWPAFVVLVLTGLWNASAIDFSATSWAWKVVFIIKLVLVVVTGLASFLHTKAKSKKLIAAWGSVAGTSAIAVLVLGIFITG